MPKTPKEVLADPTFYKLPDAEQQKVLATLDPSFGALPMTERTKVLQMGKSRLGQTPAEASQSHAQAGYTTTQGAPQDEPGFFSRLAETTGVPTSFQQLKPDWSVTGPQAAPVMGYRYLKNLVQGATAPPSAEESQQLKEHPVSGAANIGSKYILGDILGPVGGQGVNQFAEDLGQGKLLPAGGDLTGTILNLLALKGHEPKTVERLVAATDAMPKDVRRALPDLKAEVKASGRPGGSRPVDVLGDRINAAEKKLNAEFALAAGPHANTVFGTQSIANKIRGLIQPNMDMTERGRQAKAAIENRALEFEKPWTIGKLDRERIDANSRLNSFHKKGDVEQYAATGSAMGTAIDKVIADAVRDEVYPFIDQLSGKPPGTTRALKQRIGALMNMSSDLKGHAEATEKQSMKSAGGAGKLPKLRGVVGEGGMPRVFLSEPMSGNDPFKVANKAAAGAFPHPARAAINNAYVSTFPMRQQEAKERAQRLVQQLAGTQ